MCNRSFWSSQRIRALVYAGIVLAGIASTGCYHHVIRVEGPGSDGVDVYQPNVKYPGDETNLNSQVAPNKTIGTKKSG